tara:strand:+ start:9070 stop:9285 length:216 start_codon:yes stop_codon:yes gene_type:complete
MTDSNEILAQLKEIRKTLTDELNRFKKLSDIPTDIKTTLKQIESKLAELYKEIDLLSNQTRLEQWGVEIGE